MLHAGRSRARRLRGRAAAAALVLAGLGVAASAQAETLLRARLNSDILSTNPGIRRDENTDAVLMHVGEGLVALREDGEVGPLLAQSWSVSPDGRTYRFTLRTGVRFHNGAPLTSAEAAWSLRRYFAPRSGWRCSSEFGPGGIATVQSIETPDATHVAVRLDRAAPLFLKTLARPDCGDAAILHPASVGPDGAWRAPIGTGPFRFSAWKHNQYVELRRYAGYAALPGPRDGDTGGKHALVDRLRFLVIPDSSAATAALMRGSLDVLDGVSPTDLGALRGRRDVRLEMSPTTDDYVVLLQTADPLLRDARLRRALALSIDTAALTRVITWGTGRATNSPVPTVSRFATPLHRTLRPVDLAQARRLVQASGYRGQPIRLLTNRRYPQMFDAAIIIQAMARKAGINLQIEVLDWASQQDRYVSGHYQAMTYSFSARPDPSMNFALLIGDKRQDPRKVWDTPRAHALLRQSAASDDPASRQAAFDALQRDFLTDTPAIVLFNSSRIAAVRSSVRGYRTWPAALQRLWDVTPR